MGKSAKARRLQKSKKVRSQEKGFKTREDLASLIDDVRAQRNSESQPPHSSKSNEIATKDDVLQEFQSIFAKFQAPDKSDEPASNSQNKRIDAGSEEQDLEEDEIKPALLAKSNYSISNKKLRKLSKPSLSELKSTVAYPEVIQWYDCDAQDPVLLSKIKSQKNVVPVPGHWQLKRGYLSARSVLAKKPFELPDIIRQTNIEEMRSTLPNQDTGDKSLKEASRARVRPKLGSLDLDYRKLHDAFFKFGANWKPDLLLSYGDVFYENRNLEEEAKWCIMERDMRPGRIGKTLRAAMGLPEGKLPPWCSKFKELGMPPSYYGFKVAGVNWDITNLHGDVYGSFEIKREDRKDRKLFGEMLDLEESDEDTNEDKEDPTNTVSAEIDEAERLKDLEEARKKERLEAQIQAETMKEVLRRRQQDKKPSSDPNRPKSLYSVIAQSEEASGSEAAGSKVIYDIRGSQNMTEREDEVDGYDKTKHTADKPKIGGSEDAEKFKF